MALMTSSLLISSSLPFVVVGAEAVDPVTSTTDLSGLERVTRLDVPPDIAEDHRVRLTILYLLLLFTAPVLVWLTGSDQRRADFTWAVGTEPNTLDPQRMSWLKDIRLAECLFEPLVRMRMPDMIPEPAAARAWTVSDDGLTYTFSLRGDARWSNGDAVRASDFVYAWRRAMLPDSSADYIGLMHCIEGAEAFFHFRTEQVTAYRKGSTRSASAAARLHEATVAHFDQTVGVRAVDDHTLRVQLARRTPYFIELCAFATFMPVHAASHRRFVAPDPDTGMLKTDTQWIKPDQLVSNGPYQLARWRFKRDILLVANTDYWNAADVGPRTIVQRIIESPATQWLSFRGGEVDWLPELPSTSTMVADLVAEGRDTVHVIPGAGTYFYNFNCKSHFTDGRENPLTDPRVRRALSMAVNRTTLVTKVTRLRQPVARTFVPVDVLPDYSPPAEAGLVFDLANAKQLLAEAGHAGGHGLEGLAIMYNTGAGHERIAQAIKAMWQEHLGVSVTLEGVEGRRFSDRLKNQDYAIARAGWFGDYRDPTTFLDKFLTENGNNDAAWSNPAFDAMLAEAAMTAEAPARIALLEQAEALMLDEQPIMPLFHYVSVHVFDAKRVRNLWPNAWHLRRLERVQISR